MENKDSFVLYHRTQPNKVLDIIRGNRMLPSTRNWFEKPRVSFSNTPDLTEFGSVVIAFDGHLLSNETSLKEFVHSKSMLEDYYEKGWFVEGVVENVREFILHIDFNVDIDYEFDTVEDIRNWAQEIDKFNIEFSIQSLKALEELEITLSNNFSNDFKMMTFSKAEKLKAVLTDILAVRKNVEMYSYEVGKDKYALMSYVTGQVLNVRLYELDTFRLIYKDEVDYKEGIETSIRPVKGSRNQFVGVHVFAENIIDGKRRLAGSTYLECKDGGVEVIYRKYWK